MMMAKRRTKERDVRLPCQLTTSKQKRAAADMLSESVRAGFPAGISRPALRALASAGFTELSQLSRISEAELLKLHGMGPKAIAILREALSAMGEQLRN
jgi:hypothetical protein